jgi:uncharacterized protein YaaN involved in tellurite resistance
MKTDSTEKKDIGKIEANVRETLGLSRDFSPQEQEAALRVKAEQFIDAMINGDASSNEKQTAIFSLASAEQQKVIDIGKGFSVRLKDLKQDSDGKKISDILEELSTDFDRINPGKINWKDTPRKKFRSIVRMIPILGGPISKYWQQYEDVIKMINENITMVEKLLDKKEADIITINARKDAFLGSMAEYHNAIVAGIIIKETLEKKIDEEADEQKQRFMQENWLYPLNKRIMALQESYLSSFDSAISAELIARGHRELIMDIREKNKIASLRLQTGAWLAAELYDQKQMLESLNALKTANKNLADTIHQMLGTYQEAIQNEATTSFQEFEQWQRHMQQTIQLYDNAKDFRVKAIPVLNEKITQFDDLMQIAEKKAKEIEASSNTQMELLG